MSNDDGPDKESPHSSVGVALAIQPAYSFVADNGILCTCDPNVPEHKRVYKPVTFDG